MERPWPIPAMTPRERVAAAVRRLPHNRIPVDLGGTSSTALMARACAALRARRQG
jgi:hypothetical protein